MDKQEARQILGDVLARYRDRPHDDLACLIDRVEPLEVAGPSGQKYQVEVQALWDDKPLRHIRVMAAIDDGGWRAFMPLCDDFIFLPMGASLASRAQLNTGVQPTDEWPAASMASYG